MRTKDSDLKPVPVTVEHANKIVERREKAGGRFGPPLPDEPGRKGGYVPAKDAGLPTFIPAPQGAPGNKKLNGAANGTGIVGDAMSPSLDEILKVLGATKAEWDLLSDRQKGKLMRMALAALRRGKGKAKDAEYTEFDAVLAKLGLTPEQYRALHPRVADIRYKAAKKEVDRERRAAEHRAAKAKDAWHPAYEILRKSLPIDVKRAELMAALMEVDGMDRSAALREANRLLADPKAEVGRAKDARLRGEGPSRYAPPVGPAAIVKPLGSKARPALCLECKAKPAAKGEHFCSKACEKAWIARKFPEDAARGFTLDRALDAVARAGANDASANEEYQRLLKELDTLRARQPRPIHKLFGSNGPTVEQKTKYDADVRAYNSAVGKIRRQLPGLLKKANEEFAASRTKGADRSRMHRALDALLDRRAAMDALTPSEVKELATLKERRKRRAQTAEETARYFELQRKAQKPA